jgi:hypothetical protein
MGRIMPCTRAAQLRCFGQVLARARRDMCTDFQRCRGAPIVEPTSLKSRLSFQRSAPDLFSPSLSIRAAPFDQW